MILIIIILVIINNINDINIFINIINIIIIVFIILIIILDQTSDIDINIGHRHLWSRSARWFGRDSGPHKWAPEMRVLKPVYKKGLICEKVHAWRVYSTFGSITSKYSSKTPWPKNVRTFRERCMHET